VKHEEKKCNYSSLISRRFFHVFYGAAASFLAMASQLSFFEPSLFCAGDFQALSTSY
jgi:hypothetical protein